MRAEGLHRDRVGSRQVVSHRRRDDVAVAPGVEEDSVVRQVVGAGDVETDVHHKRVGAHARGSDWEDVHAGAAYVRRRRMLVVRRTGRSRELLSLWHSV